MQNETKSLKHRKIQGFGATTFSKHHKMRYLMHNGTEIEHLGGSFGGQITVLWGSDYGYRNPMPKTSLFHCFCY